MRNCPYQAIGEVTPEEVETTVSKMTESAIRKLARETPELYYKWYIETYAAQRKALLHYEFQSALLDKLQRCGPNNAKSAA